MRNTCSFKKIWIPIPGACMSSQKRGTWVYQIHNFHYHNYANIFFLPQSMYSCNSCCIFPMKHLFEEMYVTIQHLTLLEWLAINLPPKFLEARKLTLNDFYSILRGTFHSRSFHRNINPLPQTWGPRAFFGGLFSVLTGSVVNSFDSKCLVDSIPASICQFVWSGWFFSPESTWNRKQVFTSEVILHVPMEWHSVDLEATIFGVQNKRYEMIFLAAKPFLLNPSPRKGILWREDIGVFFGLEPRLNLWF